MTPKPRTKKLFTKKELQAFGELCRKEAIDDVLRIIKKEVVDLQNNGGNNRGNYWTVAYTRVLDLSRQVELLKTQCQTVSKETKVTPSKGFVSPTVNSLIHESADSRKGKVKPRPINI